MSIDSHVVVIIDIMINDMIRIRIRIIVQASTLIKMGVIELRLFVRV